MLSASVVGGMQGEVVFTLGWTRVHIGLGWLILADVDYLSSYRLFECEARDVDVHSRNKMN